MTASLSVVPEPTPVEDAWNFGEAVGRTCAAMLGTPMEPRALVVIEVAKETAPRASNVLDALADCYSLDLTVRRRVATDAGVLHGWTLGTEGRTDRVECACSVAICTDVEVYRVCAGELHEGVWCTEQCQRDGGCARVPECLDMGRDR